MVLFCDIETFSGTDIKHGVYAYSEDPDFEILMCAWAKDDGPVQLATTRQEILDIPGLWNSTTTKVAHNAQFERVCFTNFLVKGKQFEYLPPEEWIDTMALAGQAGLPQSLGKLAVALGAEEKDEAGTRLINTFCKYQRGRRIQPQDHPDLWEEFKNYCIQDVETLRDVYRRLPKGTRDEQRLWEVDQRINDRGIRADLNLARLAIETDNRNQAEYRIEMCELLDIDNAGSTTQIMNALRRMNFPINNLRRDTIDEVLASKIKFPPNVVRILQLRQETALVASKKYQAAVDGASPDGRVRGGFRFYGAHTGRWSGRGIQLQNLPKLQFTRVDPITGKSEYDPIAEASAILDLELGLGADATTLKKLVRSMFVGPFTVVDYAAIEARILAWWAREQWATDAFAAGRDIYVETAERMGGLTRQQGKVAVLALGYNGGIHSLRNMGAEGSDEKLQQMVYAWRRANPNIVRMWKAMESAFLSGGPLGKITIEREGKDRHVFLPSGRAIVYHDVKRVGQGRGERILFKDHRGNNADTYGGRLVENVVQAVSRDVLARALINLEERGFATVAHVHDEVVIEGTHDPDEIAKIMCDVDWADGLPLEAVGFHCERYRKG